MSKSGLLLCYFHKLKIFITKFTLNSHLTIQHNFQFYDVCLTTIWVSLSVPVQLSRNMFNYHPQRSCGKVIFHRHLSFILFTGGCLPQCMLGYTPPPARHPPGRHPTPGQADIPPPGQTPPADTPWADIPLPTGRNPLLEDNPPWADNPPPLISHCCRWHASYWNAFLPPTTKLGQAYVFTGVCDSVHRGGVPDQVHPPGTRYTSPQTRYTLQDQVHPWDQVHHLGPDTLSPPDQVHHPPWDQVHPPGTRYTPLGPGTPPRTRYTPGPRYTPRTWYPPGPGTPRAQHAGRYGLRAAVRILLECNLVFVRTFPTTDRSLQRREKRAATAFAHEFIKSECLSSTLRKFPSVAEGKWMSWIMIRCLETTLLG